MKTIIILSTLCCLCSGYWLDPAKSPANVVAGCCPLTGTWITESGTYIELKHNADGSVTGNYHSLSGDGGMERIQGQAGSGKPTTFGMVVSFKDGKSMVWTGQYQFCDGEPALTTRWMMTSPSRSCGKLWKSTHSGSERFVRKYAGSKSSKLGHYIRKSFKKVMRGHVARKLAQ